MSRFRKVDAGTWSDRWFCELTPDAKLLWLYFLTGREVTSLPGIVVAGKAQLAEGMGWTVEHLLSVFAKLGDRVLADWDARVVWLPNATRYNEPSNPNVVLGWREPMRLVPECQLKTDASKALLHTCEWLGEPFAKAFAKALGEPFLARVRAAPASLSSSEISEASAVPPVAEPEVKVRMGGAAAFELAQVYETTISTHTKTTYSLTRFARNDVLALVNGHGPKDGDANALAGWLGAATGRFVKACEGGDSRIHGGWMPRRMHDWLNAGAPDRWVFGSKQEPQKRQQARQAFTGHNR